MQTFLPHSYFDGGSGAGVGSGGGGGVLGGLGKSGGGWATMEFSLTTVTSVAIRSNLKILLKEGTGILIAGGLKISNLCYNQVSIV